MADLTGHQMRKVAKSRMGISSFLRDHPDTGRSLNSLAFVIGEM